LASNKEIVINGVKGIEAELTRQDGTKIRSIVFPVRDKFLNIQYPLDGLQTDFDDNQADFESHLKNGETLVSSFRLADDTPAPTPYTDK